MNKIRIFLLNHPAWVIGGFCLISMAVGIPYGYIKNHNEYRDTCQSYCKCQETGNCSYTFEYKDVKDCDCEVK